VSGEFGGTVGGWVSGGVREEGRGGKGTRSVLPSAGVRTATQSTWEDIFGDLVDW
jgi:hypothetical protein